MECLFVTDLHGRLDRFEKLFDAIITREPDGVFIGGDLLPHAYVPNSTGDPDLDEFVRGYLAKRFREIRKKLGKRYPSVFVILGNDDGKSEEDACRDLSEEGLWRYIHGESVIFGEYCVYGYAYVPPTPFRLKDWERYDVSRYVCPGCISPEEGARSDNLPPRVIRHSTIKKDLDELAGSADLDNAILLFHTPPHDTALDRAALDGRMIDSVPLDLYVGSIAVRRFIEERRPLLTLHGHIHESTRLTGAWRDNIGRTHMFNAAHDGPELALVSFDPGELGKATREIL